MSNHNTDPTGLDCLAFHILANIRRSTDHNVRKEAIRLSNRWGGLRHYCTAPDPRHVRTERGSVATGCAVLGSLLSIIVMGVILALAVIGKAQAAEPVDGIVFNNHRVVQSSTLPSCLTEDSLSDQPCTWNVNDGDGNGQGLAYYSKGDGTLRYVWAESPLYGDETHWVNGRLRAWVMDNYDLRLDISCAYWHDSDDTSVVICANGHRYLLNF